MKKALSLVGMALAVWPAFAGAEPILFEQAANVTGAAGIEAGVEAGVSPRIAAVYTDVQVFARAGMPFLEGLVAVPFGIVSSTGAYSGSSDLSGLKDVRVMLKSAFVTLPGFALALGTQASLPTGDPKKGFGTGLAIEPFVAMDNDLGFINIHSNLGYRVTSEYSLGEYDFFNADYTITRRELKVKDGNTLHFALGLEIPAGSVLSIYTEVLAAAYGPAKYDGVDSTYTTPSTLYFAPGLRIHAGPFKAKVGVEVPLGDRGSLTPFTPAPDWRMLLGASLLFGL